MSATIHRCSDCNHQSVDHSEGWSGGYPPRVGPCSQGGCACRLTPSEVEHSNPAVEVETIPAFNHATGKWGSA